LVTTYGDAENTVYQARCCHQLKWLWRGSTSRAWVSRTIK